MHNWYGIETEAAFRRREWQREVEREARLSLTTSGNGRVRQRRLPRISLANLSASISPWLPLTSPLAPRRRTAVW